MQFGAIAPQLDLSPDVADTAKQKFHTAVETMSVSARGADNIAVAALVITSRQAGDPIDVEEVIDKWKRFAPDHVTKTFDETNTTRAISAFKNQLDEDVTLVTADDVLDRVAMRAGIPDEVVDVAHRMYELLDDEQHASVTNYGPHPVAAGAIYNAVRLNDLRFVFTQKDIAEAANIAPITIRKRYQDIREALVDVLVERGELPENVSDFVQMADSEAKGYDNVLEHHDQFVIRDEELIERTKRIHDGWPDSIEDLPGVGVGRAGHLQEAGFETVVDIVEAADHELLAVTGVGESALETICGGIQEYRELLGPHPVEAERDEDCDSAEDIDEFIEAFGDVPNVGNQRLKVLANNFSTVEAVMEADPSTVASLPTLGEQVTRAVQSAAHDYLAAEENPGESTA